jgi:hypothetical protein
MLRGATDALHPKVQKKIHLGGARNAEYRSAYRGHENLTVRVPDELVLVCQLLALHFMIIEFSVYDGVDIIFSVVKAGSPQGSSL